MINDTKGIYLKIIVIGGGTGAPGVAAGRRGDLVEADYMGSTCLNAGCIPAKCLLHTAELVSQMNEQGADIGMKVSGVEVPPGDCL